MPNEVPQGQLGAFYRCGCLPIKDKPWIEHFQRCGLRFPRFDATGGIVFQIGETRDLFAPVPVVTMDDYAMIARDAAPRVVFPRSASAADRVPGPAVLLLLPATADDAEKFREEGSRPKDTLEDVAQQLAAERARRVEVEDRLMKLELAVSGGAPATGAPAADPTPPPPASSPAPKPAKADAPAANNPRMTGRGDGGPK